MTEAPKDFYSIENMSKHENAGQDLIKIGQRISGNRKFILYQDENGNGWYKTMIRTTRGWEDEETAIFGRRIKKGIRYT